MDEHHQLVDALRRLFEEGGGGNFLVVEVGDYYVQIAASKGQPLAQMEAVSNAYLAERLALGEDAEAQLERHGFRQPDQYSNWMKHVSIGSPSHRRAIAQEVVTVLENVYAVRIGEMELELNLDENPRLENPDLREAIASGSSLFDAMAEAHVYVPISARTEAGDDVYHHDDDGLVVFTEHEALDAWNRDNRSGLESVVCLLPVAARLADEAGLSVNPGGSYSFALTAEEAALLVRRFER